MARRLPSDPTVRCGVAHRRRTTACRDLIRCRDCEPSPRRAATRTGHARLLHEQPYRVLPDADTDRPRLGRRAGRQPQALRVGPPADGVGLDSPTRPRAPPDSHQSCAPIRTRRSARGSSCFGSPHCRNTPAWSRVEHGLVEPPANAAVAPAASRSTLVTATATRRTGTPSRRRSWAMAATTPVHVRASGRRFRHSLPSRSGDQIRPGGHCVILLGCLPRSRRYRHRRRRLEHLTTGIPQLGGTG